MTNSSIARLNSRTLSLIVVAAVTTTAMACSTESGEDSEADQAASDQAGREISQQLDNELATTSSAATSSLSSVKPVLKCVEKVNSTTYKAHFSYNNTGSTTISIPVGFNNRFYPSPTGRGQPTSFAPGLHADVVQVSFSKTSAIGWILGFTYQVATSTSTACPAATGTGGAVGTGGSAGKGGAGGAGGKGGAGGMVGCPSTCDDHNPCTNDLCNSTTGFKCQNVMVANGQTCSDGNSCTISDTCQAGVCTAGTPRTCPAIDQCHTAGVCDPTTGACTTPTVANGTACSDNNACTTGETCQTGTCTPATTKTCAASDQCHSAGTCDPTSGVCSNPALANGTTCNDGNACTTGDACQTGACAGAPKSCAATDTCHAAGTCNTTTGACSNLALADGTTCNDGNMCTTVDACAAGVCVGGAPKVCATPDMCHAPGTCAPGTGVCSNPALANGTVCDDGNKCSIGDSCQAGACAPAQVLTPTHCAGTACDICSFDPDVGNCFPFTDGCDAIDDPSDRNLCESIYACFLNPVNGCTVGGDALKCWCGTSGDTCATDNTGSTKANGPCLDLVTAGAKLTPATYDAPTIKARQIDPNYPLGRAINLTTCRGTFCPVECSIP